MNIVEFLEARIAEDEVAANNATGARWVLLSGVNASMVNIDPTNVRDEKWKYGRYGHIATTSHDAAYAEHIARQNPARVLAECKAKRAILAKVPRNTDPYDPEGYTSMHTIRALAAVHADHPDYQQEWAL